MEYAKLVLSVVFTVMSLVAFYNLLQYKNTSSLASAVCLAAMTVSLVVTGGTISLVASTILLVSALVLALYNYENPTKHCGGKFSTLHGYIHSIMLIAMLPMFSMAFMMFSISGIFVLDYAMALVWAAITAYFAYDLIGNKQNLVTTLKIERLGHVLMSVVMVAMFAMPLAFMPTMNQPVQGTSMSTNMPMCGNNNHHTNSIPSILYFSL